MKKHRDGLSKRQKQSGRTNNIGKQKYIRTGIAFFTAIAVFVGIYLAVAWAQHSPGVSSTESESSSAVQNSEQSPSLILSGSESDSSTSISAEITSALPTPTKAPTAPANITGSTVKDGWWYYPAKTGAASTTSAAHVSVCDRFDGIWQADTTKKIVYITMDVGYDNNGTTAKMLDIAKEKNIKITFFITGAMFETPALKALVLRMENEGHLVGNHTWDHPSLPDMLNSKGAAAVNAELDKVEAAFKTLTGKEMAHYMRPPMGEFSEATMQMMQKRGYKTVFWSFAYKDWDRAAQPDPVVALQRTLNGLHNGVVYLLHAVSDTNVEILPKLIDEIRTQGYEFGLVNDIK